MQFRLGFAKLVEDLEVELNSEEFQQAKTYFSNRYFREGNPTYAFDQLRVQQGFQNRVRAALLDEDVDTGVVFDWIIACRKSFEEQFSAWRKAAYAFADQLDNFRHANAVLMSAIPLWDEP